MTERPPKNRRKFAAQHGWDEILYLYDKIHYWFYKRRNRVTAAAFLPRLRRLLRVHDTHHESIKGEECWSLLCEIKGNIKGAIRYRLREIELMRRLRQLKNGTKMCKARDLAERMELLAILYHDSGKTKEAVSWLLGAKRVCQNARIEFESNEMLSKYRETL